MLASTYVRPRGDRHGSGALSAIRGRCLSIPPSTRAARGPPAPRAEPMNRREALALSRAAFAAAVAAVWSIARRRRSSVAPAVSACLRPRVVDHVRFDTPLGYGPDRSWPSSRCCSRCPSRSFRSPGRRVRSPRSRGVIRGHVRPSRLLLQVSNALVRDRAGRGIRDCARTAVACRPGPAARRPCRSVRRRRHVSDGVLRGSPGRRTSPRCSARPGST